MLKSLILTATLTFTSACGDGGNSGTTDSGACGGHGQPACTTDAGQEYLNHTGGEIRLEYLETNNGPSIVFYAFFVSAQTPESIPYPGNGCTNVASYVNTTNATADVNDTRTFMDVGDTITFSNPTTTPITLSRYANIPDKRGLVMDIEYAKDGAARSTVQPSTVLRGAEYEITMSGMGTFPAKLKVPMAWETVGGTLNFGTSVVNNIPAATDISWQYNFVEEPYTNSGILLFTGNNTQGVKETWFCVNPESGRVDVPASMMASFPPSGTVQAATIAHQKVDWNGRVVDVLGITCKQSPYTIQ